MTAQEFREALAAHGFTQTGFARIVGVSPRTGEKWALGETRVPGCVMLLLRLLQARPELRSVIEDMARPAVRARRG